MNKILETINISKHIANHVAGKHHTNTHRRISGITVMIVGVGIVNASHFCDVFIIHFVADVIGYAVHGLGLIPFVSSIENK